MDPLATVPNAVVAPARPRVLAGLPLGEILLAQGAVAREKLDEALAAQAERGGRLGEVLISLKACSEEQVLKALAAQLELPYQMRLATDEVAQDLINKMPINFAKQARLMPLRLDGDQVIVAMADPLDTGAVDSTRLLLGAPVSPVLVPTQAILDCINSVYDRAKNEAEQLVGDLEAGDLDTVAHELEEPQDLLDSSDEAPIIRLVNSLLFRAAKERASDIHIEPQEKDICVRFRVDGVLQEVIRPPKRFQNSIISRVKIMGGLNIAEKRLPQDGRIRVKLAGRDIDIRLSTTPTVYGERVVMRLLDKSAVLLDLVEIGMDKDQLRIMESLIHKSHGIILVTGPTGSGKTTTLYAALSKINRPDLNIMTIEDPVEYQLKGISQTPVNAKIELTFANGLRSFLRQDPDVIMVGEIRDAETANIAIHAALTGHLVLTTLHTETAAAAVPRLLDLGVEGFLLKSTLRAVIAQRLVRLLCDRCRVQKRLTAADLVADPRYGMLGFQLGDTVCEPAGCERCGGTGYRGRSGVFECLEMTEPVRKLIGANTDTGIVEEAAIQAGMTTMIDDAVAKCRAGVTSAAEVLRVTTVR